MRKIFLKTILSAVLATAVLISGISVFAANVTTKTTYNTGTGYVNVETDVTGLTAGTEVAYVVTDNAGSDIESDGSNILYIAQGTAFADGTVGFDYKIDKSKITDLSTTVHFGSDNETTFNNVSDGTSNTYIADLGIRDMSGSITVEIDGSAPSESSNAIVTFVTKGNGSDTTSTDTRGYNENVYAKVVPASDYEITSVIIDGVTIDPAESCGGYYYDMTNHSSIVVNTASTEVTAGIASATAYLGHYTFTESGEETKGFGYLIQKSGSPAEVGICYRGTLYPALQSASRNDFDTTNNTVTVLLILDGANAESELYDAYGAGNRVSNMIPYFRPAGSNDIYKANLQKLGELVDGQAGYVLSSAESDEDEFYEDLSNIIIAMPLSVEEEEDEEEAVVVDESAEDIEEDIFDAE